jgi:zinc transport system substrate-binding protein
VRSRLAALALTASLAVSGCSDDSSAADADALQVTAAFYPYAFLVERIGGPDVELTTLTRPGAEPHDLELTPQQVGGLGETDLVVYAQGFQPALDEAVAQQAEDRAFDANAATELVDGYVPLEDGELEPEEEGLDPHVWLDPTRYAQVAEALAERLTELEPSLADGFAQRSEALVEELEALDAELQQGLTRCARREIVTSHNAFGYLAARYDLEQIAVTGITPEEEPTPRRLADVARLAKQRGVTTVFFEELVSPRTAESLAREVGAKAEVLSPLEGPPETGDYLTAMRANLATLRTALGCT